VLFSFVYAAVTHVLSTAGAIIIASKRIRLSWFNMDVGRTVVHLRVVDRPVGFARSKVLGHWVDRILLLDCGGHLSQRTSRLPVQILALAIQIGGWIWYFAALQTSLSG